MNRQFLIPAYEDKRITVSWSLASILSHHITWDGITIQLRTVWILENDDWRRLNRKVDRHLRYAMLVILASTREDEETLTIYSRDPSLRRSDIIVQRHTVHPNIVQVGTAIEHQETSLVSKRESRQFRNLFQLSTYVKHLRITMRSQVRSWQNWRFGQI